MALRPLSILTNCLADLEREQTGSSCPVVDHEVIPGSQGAIEDTQVWLVCRNRAEQREFVDTAFARTRAELQRRLLAHGFPESALPGLRIAATSREDLAARGGRFAALD